MWVEKKLTLQPPSLQGGGFQERSKTYPQNKSRQAATMAKDWELLKNAYLSEMAAGTGRYQHDSRRAS